MSFPNPASIWSDPTFLAYRAALGLESDTSVSRLRSAQDAARRNAAQQVADIGLQGQQSRVGIGNNFEGRGMSRSSGREITMARQRQGEGRQVAGVQSGLANQTADYEGQIAAARAAAARQAAEVAFQAAPRVQRFAEGY